MGAYYAACIKYQEEKEWKRYTSWRCKYGAKLLEHTSLASLYVSEVTKLILYKPAYFAWLCDYHEKEDENDLDWDTVEENESWNPESDERKCPSYYAVYVNLTKKEFFDTFRLLHLIAKLVEKGDLNYFSVIVFEPLKKPSRKEYYPYILHPLPFLTNSDDSYMGGGDYDGDYPLKKRWYRDLIVAVSPVYSELFRKAGFKDITAGVPVPVDRDQDEEFKCFASFINFVKYYRAKNISEAIIKSYNSFNMVFPPRNDSEVVRILKNSGSNFPGDISDFHHSEYKKNLCQLRLF